MYDTLVDAFGLDEFGNPYGLGEAWGAGIGAAVGAGAAIAATTLLDPAKHPDLVKHAEGIGLAAAVAAGGVMMIFPGTRRAGLIGALTGVIANGSRWGYSMAKGHAIGAPSAGLGLTHLQRLTRAGMGRAALGDTVFQKLNQLGDPRLQLVGPNKPAVISAPTGHFGANVMGQ